MFCLFQWHETVTTSLSVTGTYWLIVQYNIRYATYCTLIVHRFTSFTRPTDSESKPFVYSTVFLLCFLILSHTVLKSQFHTTIHKQNNDAWNALCKAGCSIKSFGWLVPMFSWLYGHSRDRVNTVNVHAVGKLHDQEIKNG